MKFRVCIPCAGTGSRLGELTRFINKSLVSVANRPALSHLIEKFPSDTEFVIALGYKGDIVREFLSLAYPNREFYFAEVSVFEGPGSGLGLSLQACKPFLQQPFIFISCDTLVKEPIPAPDRNWMGYAEVSTPTAYRTLSITSGIVTSIAEKSISQAPDRRAYIGLAGIHNYLAFWDAMETGGQIAVEGGEAHGMRHLLHDNIHAEQFTWHDTGTHASLAETRLAYRESDEPNILEKPNEAIWFVEDTVIKFCSDPEFIANRIKRSVHLEGFVPIVTGHERHMYQYSKIKGKVFSEVVNIPLFERLLVHCIRFWHPTDLNPPELRKFQSNCLIFYRDKTFDRIALFYKISQRVDDTEHINGMKMPKLEELLNSIDWGWLANGLPGRFHGDLHFENILWSENSAQFTLLDWRQDFGGDLSTGDVYYDLSKLLHGLIVSHQIVTNNSFEVFVQSKAISFNYSRRQILVECEQYFRSWLEFNGYDRKKVYILAALIFLNIAALHRHPYSLLLYALGKSMLKSELEE